MGNLLLDTVLPVLAALATTVLLTGAYFWFTSPGPTLRFLLRLAAILTGMRLKDVKVDGLNVCYAEKGKQKPGGSPSMLFVHGFSAAKDMWLTLIPLLPRDQHVVLVDLPGHGDSDIPTEDMEIHTTDQTKFLNKVVNAIELNKEPFHLIGLSMGGAIAGLYASLYPKDLAFLTVICPAMPCPTETDFMKEARNGRCRLLPDTTQGIKEMLEICVYYKNRVPKNKQILKALLELRRPNMPFYTRLFEVLTECMDEKFSEMVNHIAEIQAPTQIIWGINDELVHVSGANYLRDRCPSCRRVDIMEQCGHMPTLDNPAKVVKLLLDFRGELPKKK